MPRGEYGYGIRGNTVVKPVKKTTIRKPKINEEQKRKKKDDRKRKFKNLEKQNDRKYMFTMVMVILGLGCITIAGDSKVYRIQKEVTALERQISSINEENEALRVKVLKYSSLGNIEENAGSTLGMYVPNSEDVVKIDFSENYFEDVTVDNDKENKNRNRIFDFFDKFFK